MQAIIPAKRAARIKPIEALKRRIDMKRLFDKDTWQEIFGSIQKNKIRTIITMIGVSVGNFYIYSSYLALLKELIMDLKEQFQSG